MNSHHNKGFTIIELLSVIIIVGIISATAISHFSDLSTQAKCSDLDALVGTMRSSLAIVHSQAIIEGQDKGSGTITIDGTSLPLHNGYPAVNGGDDFDTINKQVLSWLDIDAVDRNTARANRNAAQFFTDKSSRNNQIFIFFSEDYDKKSVGFRCQIRYQNQAGSNTPEVRVLSDAC